MLKHIIVLQGEWAGGKVQLLARQENKLRSLLVQIMWGLPTLTTVVVCVATAASFLGRFIWFLELSTHFRWQYCLFLLALAVVFTLAGKRRQALAAGLFGLVNLALIVPLYGPAVPPSPSVPIYRALMLNVLHKNNDYESVKTLIGTANPDLFVLVEVTELWEAALQSVEVAYPFVSQPLFDGYKEIVLYSRFPFTVVETPAAPYPNRSPVVAMVNVAGQRLTVIGAHPQSPERRSGAALRNQQMALMAHVAAGQPGPVLLLGDLNITPWSPFFHDFLAASGLRNGRQGFGIQPSWPVQRSLLSIPIDHALASPEITIHNFETGPYVGSDHYPIIVDFSIHSQSQLAQRP
jgi:endonuclease/exonuclease/phosphatase (EEP) superfamily protein YafD